MWPGEALLGYRWISKDLHYFPFSPFGEDRISVEVWTEGFKDPPPGAPELGFIARYEMLIKKLRASGVLIHYHPGKVEMDFVGHYGGSGPLDLQDAGAAHNIREFLKFENTTDPRNLFSNQFMERLRRHIEEP